MQNIPNGIFLYLNSKHNMPKAEETRQLIIEKTAPIFNKKGFAGTSLSDLTEATGLTKGSIYGNFANKDEVALAAFDHNWQSVSKKVRDQMQGATNATEKLLAYVNVFSNFNEMLPGGGCPILNTAVDADDTNPALKRKALTAFTNWKKNITSIIEEGIKAKEFKKNIVAENAALTIIALAEGSIMIGKLTGKSNYHRSVMNAINL